MGTQVNKGYLIQEIFSPEIYRIIKKTPGVVLGAGEKRYIIDGKKLHEKKNVSNANQLREMVSNVI